MNDHEMAAWRTLLNLGAVHWQLGNQHALNLSPIRLTSARRLAVYTQAVIEVVGRSGANRRHVDRYGRPVFVVTDHDLGRLPEGKRDARGRTTWAVPHD